MLHTYTLHNLYIRMLNIYDQLQWPYVICMYIYIYMLNMNMVDACANISSTYKLFIYVFFSIERCYSTPRLGVATLRASPAPFKFPCPLEPIRSSPDKLPWKWYKPRRKQTTFREKLMLWIKYLFFIEDRMSKTVLANNSQCWPVSNMLTSMSQMQT